MIRAFVLAAALASAPSLALAQDAAAPADSPAEAAAPGQAEFEATAQAFGARMQEMAEEMRNAVSAAGGDAAKQDADLDAIEVRYQADVDAFAASLRTFVGQQAAALPEAERAQMTAAIGAALPQIQAYPRQIRAQVEQAAATPAPAAPAS